jgi:uncharacterized repeat protein (TIGR03943 family)
MIAVGALALWMSTTDAMLKYLKPSMRPWLLLAAIGLSAIGVSGYVRARHRTDTNHDHHTRVGWLLVVPLLVVIGFGANSLGAFAASRRSTHLPPYAFDIAAYAEQTGQHAPALRLADVLEGLRVRANRSYLAAHDVKLEGFVSQRGVIDSHSFVLTRFLVSCCAADAMPLNIVVLDADTVPDVNQWVVVTARLADTTPDASGDDPRPVMRASRIQRVEEPKAPYESLR